MSAIEICPTRVALDVSGDAGLVTLTQGGVSLSFVDRDALAVAREILSAAGYEWIMMHHNVGGWCLDVGEAEPPDSENDNLQETIARRFRNQPEAPDLFERGGA
jgi:hypothetical protein